MTSPVVERVRDQMGEFFLLKETTRVSAGRSEAQQNALRKYFRAAFRRMQAAQVLRGPDLAPAALSLYREAAFLFVSAFLLSQDDTVDPAGMSHESVFNRFSNALAADRSEAPANWETSKPFLVSTDLLQLDRLPGEESERVAANLEATTKWLAELVDARSPRELRVTSLVRIGIAVALVVGIVAVLGVKLFKPKNIAEGRHASASSVALATSPDAAIDGSRSGHFGFHSSEEDSPWWSVDLGQPFAISRVTVYGRDDCCFEQSTPLALEVSDDGASYRKIDERTQPFSDGDPWKSRAEAVARYVRLRALRRTYLVLGEVEVYGHKPK